MREMAPRPIPATPIAVYLESGRQRVFACAIDWPGWCRAGKDQHRALEMLATYGSRYAAVTAEAGIPFTPPQDASGFDVRERVPGSATTDFGAPGEIARADRAPMSEKEAARQVTLVEAAWRVFDRVAKGAPAELRKGPRGGGRDRDVMVGHVLGAESAYARKLDLRFPQPAIHDVAAISAMRKAIAQALRSVPGPRVGSAKGWPARYASRRIAWHVLDHAWEMEDRSR